MIISFVGDVMLGRFVREKYEGMPFRLISDSVQSIFNESDYVIANLESPITNEKESDSLRFAGSANLLSQLKWINCFSLSNNHINDFGEIGMTETVEQLKAEGFEHNGLYKEAYNPVLIDSYGEKVAVITCADMLNYEFDESCPYKTLRVNRQDEIISCIKEYKTKGYFVILFAHVGMLFTRFPNPVIRDFIHQMVDEGADCVVTAHPHCLGGSERYKDKLIIYSLGDFLMDGSSLRRRKAGILSLKIEKAQILDWSISPVLTNNELIVCTPNEKMRKKMLKSFDYVTKKIEQHTNHYTSFYKKQYKKELIAHSLSTIAFEYNRRGIKGLLRILMKRMGAVKGMTKRVFTDRSAMSYDADAVNAHNLTIDDLR